MNTLPVSSSVLLAGLDPAELEKRARTAPHEDAWRDLVAAWERAMRDEAETGKIRTSSGLGWHSVTPLAVDAGLVWRLTQRVDALRHVEACIDRLRKTLGGETLTGSRNPPGRGPVWSYGEVGLAADLCREGLSAAARETLGGLMRERILGAGDFDSSLTGHGGGRNIPLCLNIHVGLAALTWGAASGYSGWEALVNKARDVCVQYFRHGCDETGFSYEGSGYGQHVFDLLFLYAQLLYQTGREDLFSSLPAMRRAVEATLAVFFPDQSGIVNIGDVGIASPPSMPWLLLAASHFREPLYAGFWQAYHRVPARQEDSGYRWKVFLFRDSGVPCQPVEEADRPTAGASRGTGTANFRTSWGRDAVYVNFLAAGRSHVAAGHAHADAGHVSIFAHGEYLAIDTGRYNVNEDQHSVVLVEGRDHMEVPEGTWGMNTRSGRLTGFRRHGLLDHAVVEAAHMKGCIWADRHLLFVRRGGDEAYVVVLDNINCDNAPHLFLWLLQVNPNASVEVTGERTARVKGRRACLDVTFAIPCAGDFPGEPHRLTLRADEKWWAWPYGKGMDISDRTREDIGQTSLCRPRLVGELHGINGVMMAVIAPRRLDAKPLKVRQVLERRILRVEIESEDAVDTVIAAVDHGYIDLPGLRGLAELAVIRHSNRTGEKTVWTSNGAGLELGAEFGGDGPAGT